jgi:hypothetical protein
MLMFHVFVPLILERARHRDGVRVTVKWVLRTLCSRLVLSDILRPDANYAVRVRGSRI